MRRKRTQEEIRTLRLKLDKDVRQGYVTLSEGTRRMREITGKTQQEYAQFLEIAPRTLIDLERGVGNPQLKTLQKIAKPFGLQIAFVYGANTK